MKKSKVQKAVKKRIGERNGIDLNTETTLFDLGVELISCYSAIPKILSDPEATIENVQSNSSTLFCTKCGAKLAAAAKFCTKCGTTVKQ